ncbi:hypothetical protein LTR84_012059 [Exophiala bonariae]|uniref:Zn(2)-C6 fungal-type domain-containing protein n=1 Tax=Exophiala bonariae TaxID=1690606 RepID=A0AAV9NHD8_9EURO|nr:hypothetical protein LTR84_012059 [Exophiala bonariae]
MSSMSAEPPLTQACQRCWRRKQKCGRQRPQCTECVRAGAQCLPRVWGRVLEGDGDPAFDDGSSARSVIEQMRSRIALLESQEGLSGVRNGDDAALTAHTSESSHVDPSTGTAAAQLEGALLENTTSEVGYLSVAAMSGPDRQDMNAHNSPSFATLVRHTTHLSRDPVSSRRLVNDNSSTPQSQSLLEIQAELTKLCNCDLRFFVDAYIKNAGHIFPCISQARCHEALNTALQSEKNGDALQGHHTASESVMVTCFTASLGILHSAHVRTISHSLQCLMAAALAMLPAAVAETSDIEAVRFLLLAAVLGLHRFEETSSWHFIGLAITKAISAGLHRNKIPESSSDDSQTLLWTLYNLDRACSFVMDRPFSIEDSDMTIELPQATSLATTRPTTVDLHPFFVWSVHYARTMSEWKRQLVPDPEICHSSFAYWRETCHEYVMSTQSGSDQASSDQVSSTILVSVAEAQLTCRALVHLLLQALHSPLPPLSLLQRVRKGLEHEVPQYLASYKAAMDTESLGPNLLDAYDILAAFLGYIYSRQSFVLDQTGKQSQFGTIHIGVAGMRLVTLGMDVLQKISDRFEPILDLKELLWCFLTALESHGQSTTLPGQSSQPTAVHTVREALSESRIPVPPHLALLMERAFS